MKAGILVAVLLYEVISIVGIGAAVARHNKKHGAGEGGFAFAGGGLPASLVGITLALTLLSERGGHGCNRCLVRHRLRSDDGSHYADHRTLDAQNRSKNSR